MEVRKSARALLLDSLDRLLLLEYEDELPVDPRNPDLLRYWLAPGGGIEGAEGYEDALRRELAEELGISEVVIGEKIAIRNINLVLPQRGSIHSEEHYFVCHVDNPVLSHDGLGEHERRVFRDARWWSLSQLTRSPIVLRPPALPALMERALNQRSEAPVLLNE